MKRLFWVLALLGIAIGTSPSRADSIFSSVGFGRWRHTTDARGAGLGDVSLASTEAWGSFSPGNPATLAHLDRAAGYIGFDAEITLADGGDGERDTRADSRLPLLSVGAPLFAGIVGGASFYELNDGRYDIAQEIPGSPSYTLRSTGDGAWTNFRLSLARAFETERIRGSLGAQVGFPLSSIDETITREFADDDFVNRAERHENVFRDAVLVSFGGDVTVSQVTAGGFVQLPATGTLTQALLLGDEELRQRAEVDLPPAFGLGLSVPVGRSVRWFGEWRHQDWSALEIDDRPWQEATGDFSPSHGFKTVDAWGTGIELTRGAGTESRSVKKRLRYRIGFGFTPWITAGPSNGRVTDATGTLGLGIPFQSGNGVIDLALRYTQRREGGSELSEDVVGLVVGVGFAKQPRSF
jgi:hypothetical protein